jgi:hypothetical protein
VEDDGDTHLRRRRDHRSDYPHGVSWWKCRNQWLLMDTPMGFVCAGVVTPVVTPSSQSAEAATVASGIAAHRAGSEGGNNNCRQRADVTKRQKQASSLTAPSACVPPTYRAGQRDASRCAFGQAGAAMSIEPLAVCDLLARQPLERSV